MYRILFIVKIFLIILNMRVLFMMRIVDKIQKVFLKKKVPILH